MSSLAERINVKIEELRPLIKEYNLLDEAAQRATRHEMYLKTGEFGKAFKELFAPFAAYETKIALKKTGN